MRKFLAAALITGLWLITPPHTTNARPFNAQQRAQDIAAFFNKTKHKVKERHGVRVERYLEIRGEPVLKSDARDYAGTYEADSGTAFHLRVGADGRVEADGAEPAPHGARHFVLKDASISGALLTATKVYDDGTTEKFEGVFINRTERHSPTDKGVTTFGLGVVYDPPKVGTGFSITRLFYQQK